METKICRICKIEKLLSQFRRWNKQCKVCKDRKDNLARYKISIRDYDDLDQKQKGVCAICGLPEIGRNKFGKKRLAVDHNHNTGKVRGLLCQKCNRAIGVLNVDNFGTLNLRKAIEYLETET